MAMSALVVEINHFPKIKRLDLARRN